MILLHLLLGCCLPLGVETLEPEGPSTLRAIVVGDQAYDLAELAVAPTDPLWMLVEHDGCRLEHAVPFWSTYLEHDPDRTNVAPVAKGDGRLRFGWVGMPTWREGAVDCPAPVGLDTLPDGVLAAPESTAHRLDVDRDQVPEYVVFPPTPEEAQSTEDPRTVVYWWRTDAGYQSIRSVYRGGF